MRLDPDEMPPRLAAMFVHEAAHEVIAGVNGDDCAVLRWGTELMVVTTDFLNARPIATELNIGGLRELGRLVVAANLSDLCGTGAAPRALLIAVTMPREATEAEFLQLMEGVRFEAARWQVPVVGGDTKLGAVQSILGVAIGHAETERNLFLKTRARAGDLLWSSGPLGSCTAAVMGLSRGAPNNPWREWAVAAITDPDLPLAKSRALSLLGLGGGGTDVSDGLGADLRSLCAASDVGAVVEVDRMPIAPEARQLAEHLSIEPWKLPFGFGGDFQFIVTTRPDAEERVAAMGFHRIGRITLNPALLVEFTDGTTAPLPEGGHRDALNLTFAREADRLVSEAGAEP